MTFAAAAPPDRTEVMLEGRFVGGEAREATCRSMEFWKITPPMTMEREVAIFRTNPKVPVAVAVSCCETKAWRPRRGASKRAPAPMPATIWKPMMEGREVVAEKRV